MRLPVRHLSGHLLWTTSAQVWAVFRVETANYTYAPAASKLARLKALEALLKALSGEALLLSLCPRIDPGALLARIADGIDLAASPAFTAAQAALREQLEVAELSGRVDFLCVPLPSSKARGAAAAKGSALHELGMRLGVPPKPVSVAEEEERLAQARALAAGWPPGVAMRPASEAEILWIIGHSARRGLAEPLLPEPGTGPRLIGRGRRVAAHTQVLLEEGGRLAEQAGGRGRGRTGNPFAHQYLRATTRHDLHQASYQAFLTLAEIPDAYRFPGAEVFASLDTTAFPIDYAVRLSIEPGARAEARARRQSRELAAQYEQYAGESAGAPDSLDRDAAAMREYRDRLTASSSEVEVRATIVLCVWGADAAEVEEKASLLARSYGASEYTLERPSGEQVPLFHAMLPGAEVPRVVRGGDYEQVFLARDFAMLMPFSGSHLGDDTGNLFGLQLSGGGVRPVLLDLSNGPRHDASASVAAIGELGGGKSYALKCMALGVLLTGRRHDEPGSRGRILAIDRTPQEEWARFAAACPGTTQIIAVDENARLSLDPLRVFSGPRAARYTESFLTPLLDLSAMSIAGVTLSEAIVATQQGPAPSMTALVDTLRRRAATPDLQEPNDSGIRAAASELVRQLRALANKDLGRTVFDPALPVIQVSDADAIVFAVSRLGLPSREELQPHRLASLEIEKKFGWRLMYLITALAREIAIYNPDEFCAVVTDECWWLTASAEGTQLLLELISDGRKHKACALLGSPDPYDIGPRSEIGDKIRGLISHRLVFRHRNLTLAARALEFLDLDPADEDLLTLVSEDLSPLDVPEAERVLRAGECLYRDLRRRVGAMKVVAPMDEAVQAALHSTPGKLSPRIDTAEQGLNTDTFADELDGVDEPAARQTAPAGTGVA
ncbi:ATP/GTP-binding protein [Mangrovactinospora gilvigrisea]|uniref:ATP/GTP-binding protein n=1 Tax=Mangrovactinospora gilvigrisea TaxID=1428644 RepID=A0A1J7CBK0_9ACTN|nr:ATP-binding protein [Mangrovactinospora gilvigrisea]OIV37010.1 ATP/GTP-binding protein [Mangrovactinospora gilvigrisea]